MGYEGYILYGPYHGTGLMEGEYPWIESNSDYLLEEGMTFCTGIYLGDDKNQIGMRIEDGFLLESINPADWQTTANTFFCKRK